MNITVENFVKNFKDKKIINTKATPDAINKYIRENLEIRTYIPFVEKRTIAEMVVAQNTYEVDGVKKNDSINQYVGFVVAMISAHTSLEFSGDPVSDYDLLSESGLLSHIIMEFQESYNECDIILKMAIAMELEDNHINAIIGRFLNEILQRLDGVGDVLKDKLGSLNLKDILGHDIKPEDMAKLQGLLDRWNK